MQLSFRKHVALLTVVFAIIPMALIGCERSASENATNSNKAAANGLPASALRFHKPKELKAAVSRMRQLHDAIASSGALPEPIKYQVKEVIHGTGASGHSHYFLHDSDSHTEHDDDHDSDDGHETTGENIHDVTIDAFVELKDLAKWLPKIASDGNLAESDWSQVNEVSKQLTPMLKEIVDQSSDIEERRVRYGKQAVSIASHLVTLEEVSK